MTSPVNYHFGKFPPKDLLQWEKLIPFLGKASASLARYDGLLSVIPNAMVFLSPLTKQEAVLSSKIEGTNVTLGEVLEIEAGIEPQNITQSMREDSVEIINYRLALQFCSDSLENRELSLSLLKEAHKFLMQGVRGLDKSPGQFRIRQNMIGPRGSNKLAEASFIPIATEHLTSGMELWEKFLNSNDYPDPLVQLAISHIEFEALHPFEDGNGRLGRMIIPLFLYKRKILSSPSFYMSEYLELNREIYHKRLREVSEFDNWTEWCQFFLQGIIEQASLNEAKARKILNLYEKIKNKVAEITHSQHAIKAVDYLFKFPVFSGPQFSSLSEIPKPTSARILNILRTEDILHTLMHGKGRRPGFYVFRELVNIAEGKDLF